MKLTGARARLLATLPVVAVLAACGGGGSIVTPPSSAGSASSTSSAAPSPATSSAPAQDAQALLDTALASMKTATSTHMKGTFGSGQEAMKLDVVMTRKGDADASITFASLGTVRIRTIGKVAYVNGNDKFWTSFGLPVKLLHGKWIKTTKQNKDFKDFVEFTQLSTWSKQLRPDGEFTVVDGKDFGGVATIGLSDGTDATMYVAADDKHYPTAIEPVKASDGGLTFTEWDAPVTVKAPPAGTIIKG